MVVVPNDEGGEWVGQGLMIAEVEQKRKVMMWVGEKRDLGVGVE